MATKWEYKALSIPLGNLESDLNKLGNDGWELTGQVLNAGDRCIYIFKRPVPSEITMQSVQVQGITVEQFMQQFEKPDKRG